MTIVHIVGSLGGGGAEQMVLQLSTKSHPEIKTKVFALSTSNELESQFKKNGVWYQFLCINSFRNKSLLNGLKLLKESLTGNNDIVFHCHQFHSVLLALIYNIRYKSFPIVFTLHSSVIKSFTRKVILFLTKPFRDTDVIFSKNARAWYLKNSIVISNGVDFKKLNIEESRNYNKTESFQFLYVGRLSPEKNPLALINFAKDLKKNTKEKFIINVLGNGNLFKNLEELIKKNKLEQFIILHGFKSDILPYFKKAHCLILPSHWEGMPVVLIEAAATKLPIISTPVGSIPDFLNNKNATICQLQVFSSKMNELIVNYEEACFKADKLYNQLKKHFDIESVYEQHLKLYKSLIY